MKYSYDFDAVIPRRGTDSFKYDKVLQCCGGYDGMLPMWVADMDFATPGFVIDAIRKRACQGVLGYTYAPERWRSGIVQWCRRQYDWEIRPEYVNYVPGVVAGINVAVQAFTDKGDRILIQNPVDHPFRIVPQTLGREIVFNDLKYTGNGFEMDMDALARDIKGCRMMILCNPNNPGGKCWSRDTLKEVASICHREGVTVLSDEIHCDMVLGGGRHIPFASVSHAAREIAITFQAPSKTFNMPGIVCAHAIVPSDELRKRYFDYLHGTDMDLGNVFTCDCALACYSDEGDRWRKEMLDYVSANIDLLEKGLSDVSDRIKVIRPEASFLVFLDCRGLGYATADEYTEFFGGKCGIGVNNGAIFGSAGLGFVRLNVGCPRTTVVEAINRIHEGLLKY